jgi:beta-galactosidase beta subunit
VKKSTKVVRPQRRRGYNDKGSLRPTEKWLESFDYSFTEEQNNKEKTLKLHKKTLTRLTKYLEELSLE